MKPGWSCGKTSNRSRWCMNPNAQPTRVESFEPPYTDPYVRWCGRGGAARLPPIPIIGTFETCWHVRSVVAPQTRTLLDAIGKRCHQRKCTCVSHTILRPRLVLL